MDYRILIVDDIFINRVLLKEIIKKFSNFCFEAQNGKEAIEILQKEDRIEKKIEELEDKVDALQKIMSHYSDKQEWEFKEEQVRMVAVFKLEVTEWSCKEH